MKPPGDVHKTKDYLRAQYNSSHNTMETTCVGSNGLTTGETVSRRFAERYYRYINPSWWVLVLGCQTGMEQVLFREMGIKNTIGLDLWVAAAAKNQVAVVSHDMHEIPFGDSAFDFVYCRDTLEHTPYPEVVLAEVSRILKPDGQALFCGPINHVAPYHYTVFSEDDYRRVFSSFETVFEENFENNYTALLRNQK